MLCFSNFICYFVYINILIVRWILIKQPNRKLLIIFNTHSDRTHNSSALKINYRNTFFIFLRYLTSFAYLIVIIYLSYVSNLIVLKCYKVFSLDIGTITLIRFKTSLSITLLFIIFSFINAFFIDK